MNMDIRIPESKPSHNLLDLGDILNGKEGDEFKEFGTAFKALREQAMNECDSGDSIYDLVQDYVKKNPYTFRKRDKKKTRLQFLFEDNYYYQQRQNQGPDHPVNIRNAKEPWNINPGRLYIPKHVSDRIREIQHSQPKST